MSINKKMSKEEKRNLHLSMMFSLIKKRMVHLDRDTCFNNTELRLLAEILAAQYEGKRLISTQLADLLGVTRSAVSQIVNRLEKENIVKRVADDVDRKIAYIEVTENALAIYKEDLERCKSYMGKIVDKFGEDNFYHLCELFDAFIACTDEVREEVNGSTKKMKGKKKRNEV